MKRVIAFLLCLMTLLSFAACGVQQTSAADGGVVCTMFYQYDFLRNICEGSGVQLTLLQKQGVDMHSYQPTAQDVVSITKADLFIFNGGESDKWAMELLATSAKGVRNCELMCLFEEEEHIHDNGEIHSEDEHIWLSVENAKVIVKELNSQLCLLYPENESLFNKNTQSYIAKLDELSEQYSHIKGDDDLLVFAGRFPFKYLIEELELTYIAAFDGCSAETEASFETVTMLADAVTDNQTEYLIVIKGDDTNIAEAVRGAVKGKTPEFIELDAIQAVDGQMLNNNADYISIMRQNLENLETIL